MRTDRTAASKWTAFFTMDALALWTGVCIMLALAAYLLSHGPAIYLQDFRAFYSAGKIMRSDPALLFDLSTQKATQDATIGGDSLLPFFHPSYEALLYAPLTFLSYRTAYFLYMAWNMLLLGACYLVAPFGKSSFACRFPRPALFFLSFPPLLCIFVGQDSLIFLLALCLIFKKLEAQDDRAAGVLLGLALFKLPLAILIALLLTARRGLRFLIPFLASAIAVTTVCLLLTGTRGFRDFLHLITAALLLSDHSAHAQRAAAVWLNAMPNLSGLLYVCGLRFLSARAAFCVNLGASLLLAGGCLYLVRKVTHNSTAFCVALLGALLLSPHLYIYDYTALLFPMLLLSNRAMPFVVTLWYVELPVLYALRGLTWFSAAVVIPIALLAMCWADQRSGAMSKEIRGVCEEPAGSNI